MNIILIILLILVLAILLKLSFCFIVTLVAIAGIYYFLLHDTKYSILSSVKSESK